MCCNVLYCTVLHVVLPPPFCSVLTPRHSGEQWNVFPSPHTYRVNADAESIRSHQQPPQALAGVWWDELHVFTSCLDYISLQPMSNATSVRFASALSRCVEHSTNTKYTPDDGYAQGGA